MDENHQTEMPRWRHLLLWGWCALTPASPRLMSRDTCLFPNIFLDFLFLFLHRLLLAFRSFSKECRNLSLSLIFFFFFPFPPPFLPIARLAQTTCSSHWSVCIHFPPRFKYLCYTAALFFLLLVCFISPLWRFVLFFLSLFLLFKHIFIHNDV